jgi:hypothetical protein
MSWFNIGISNKELEQRDKIYKRKYGKEVKSVNERKEFDLLPVIDDPDFKDNEVDTNIDEVIDYSDEVYGE